MLRRGFSTSRKLCSSKKVWSETNEMRPSFLSINSQNTKNYLFNNQSNFKPPSIKRRTNKIKYDSPEGLDDIFKLSYDFLQEKAAIDYDTIKQNKINDKLKERLAIRAEINNPEVQYNFQFNDKVDNNPDIINYEHPVYRELGRKHWESEKQMLLMQRLETLHIIPDTLPTLIPKAKVDVKFPFSTGLNKWIEPGEILSTNTTCMEPAIKVQEFDTVDMTKQLYTILIVNPDEVEISTDSFRTTLNYALTNIKIGYNDNLIDARKFVNKKQNVLKEYKPPVPEKNAGKQRFAVWAFRQHNPIDNKVISDTLDVENFDIRKFAGANKLLPVGAHVWRSKWDTNVKRVRELYSMPEGRIFSKERV